MAETPFVKFIVIVMLVLIVGSLGSGLYGLFKEDSDDRRTVKALTLRVGLSLALFVMLMVLSALGVIEPN